MALYGSNARYSNLFLPMIEPTLQALIDTSRKRSLWDGQWDGSWGNDRKEIPFKRGGPFDIRFRIHEDHFQVSSSNILLC